MNTYSTEGSLGMPSRKLGPDHVVTSAIGLGCMGMTWGYGKADRAESIATIHRALDLGVTLFDTADIYGPFINEELVGEALAGHRRQVCWPQSAVFRFRTRLCFITTPANFP
jgi:aryl-alcohol dehydrogenase-like predicted oxidoreductase